MKRSKYESELENVFYMSTETSYQITELYDQFFDGKCGIFLFCSHNAHSGCDHMERTPPFRYRSPLDKLCI